MTNQVPTPAHQAFREKREPMEDAIYQIARMIRQRAKSNWANDCSDAGRQMDSMAWEALKMGGMTDGEASDILELIDAELALLEGK